ncbi:hypothetical protein IW262DRAFT_1528173 [Armillaria fumosa]|nr:hypothetical protein IW262DRAFT_1528173 [Armillaria fumosa]
MLKEFDLPQELVDRIVDELENDHATLTNLLLVSRSFRERARHHVFRPDPAPCPLSPHLSFQPTVEGHPTPFTKCQPHTPTTASAEVLRSTALAHVLSMYPLTTLRMGKPANLPSVTSIHYGDFFDFVRCLPERIQYVSLTDVYVWEPPSAEDTSTIKGPSVGTLNLRCAGQKETVFSPNQSGVTIFSAIDQLCFWDSGFDNIRSIVRSLPPLSVQKLCIHCKCLYYTDFTSLDCLGVPSLSISINVSMYGIHALKLIIEKLESMPVESSLQNLQIILVFRLSGLLQDILLQPGSDGLWQSLAERAHRVGSCEITIINAVPFFGSSLREWDRIVSRMTTKLRRCFVQAGCSPDVSGVYCEDPDDPVELFVR